MLLCEDEPPVRAFAARALGLRGLEVVEADSGETALEALAAMGRAPDVLVTDVIMPGLDGPGWVRKARTLHPGVPVIFMSGYTEGALDDLGTDLGDAAFLPKPFSLDALIGQVEASLAARGRVQAGADARADAGTGAAAAGDDAGLVTGDARNSAT